MNSITFNYSQEDVKKAFELHFLKKFPIRSRLMLIMGMVVLGVSLVLFVFPVEAYPNMQWLFLLMGIFYIGFYFYRKRVMVNLAMKNPTIKDMSSMTIQDDSIKFAGEKGGSEIPWAAFKDTLEDDYSVLLYLSKQNFFILPKKYFNQEQLTIIRSALQVSNES